ncbi:MAG: hypothetical protein LBF85_10065 [Tannerella sp.]|jgi:hypothetical protein|nr:hypothetical protein [Tannerella sp.]
MIYAYKISYLSRLVASGIFLSALLWSCTTTIDLPIDPLEEEDGLQSVTFTVRMPNATPQSYAMNDAAENDIQTIDVLAFRIDNITGTEYFDYRAPGTDMTDVSMTEKQFKVTLFKNDTVYYRLVFLANVRSELDVLGPAKNAIKAPLLTRLLSHNPAEWNVAADYRAFPMWGESDRLRIDNNLGSLTGITLLRSVVSIEVYADDNVAVTDTFTLTDVYLYNRKVYGRVAPDGANYDATGKRVTAPTMPTVNMTTPLNVPGPLHYPVTPTDHKLVRTIYTYEAGKVYPGDDFSATCLVVGGIYIPTGRKQYYRLDFMKKDVSGNFQEYSPLLRNHRYQFIIKRVSSDGHNSPDSAFHNKKGNMEVEILAWNLADLNNVIVKEMHQLSLSRGELTVKGTGEFYVGVATDHPDGWTAVRKNAADTWCIVDGSSSDYMKITISSLAPSGGRTAIINVKAGNMTKEFKLTQQSL